MGSCFNLFYLILFLLFSADESVKQSDASKDRQLCLVEM